jgi:hypothetical protein
MERLRRLLSRLRSLKSLRIRIDTFGKLCFMMVNEECEADDDGIRRFASMTLYTLCFTVCSAHEVRLGIHD